MRHAHRERRLGQRLLEFGAFPLDAAQDGIDEAGFLGACFSLGRLDGSVNCCEILLVVHEKQLVEAEKQARVEGGLRRSRHKKFTQKIQRSELADHAIDGFHDEGAVAGNRLDQPIREIAGLQPARDRAGGNLP